MATDHAKQSPKKLMQRILDLLENEKMGDDTRVRTALDHLGLLHESIEESPPATAELEAFKAALSIQISSEENRRGIFSYLFDCENYAERGRLDGFEEACGMRSIIEFLNAEFVDWSEPLLSNLKKRIEEDIRDIDETLEDVSDEAPPIREGDIPSWAPESHWWWRAPKRQDMSQTEINDRLHYDWNDGVED